MSESVCRPLIEVLAEVPDFRKSRGKRHPLASILALICAAMLCGYKSYGAIAEWGRLYGQDLVRQLGFKNGKSPSVGTLHTVLRHLDKQALETCLGKWAEAALAHLPKTSALTAVAMDGKTLRGSAKQGACDVHLLSAVSHGLGLTLYRSPVDDKTNQIKAVEEVLAHLILEGRIVTVDALCGSIPQVMAALRNTVIGLLRFKEIHQIAAACRRHAAQPEEALALLGNPRTE